MAFLPHDNRQEESVLAWKDGDGRQVGFMALIIGAIGKRSAAPLAVVGSVSKGAVVL